MQRRNFPARQLALSLGWLAIGLLLAMLLLASPLQQALPTVAEDATPVSENTGSSIADLAIGGSDQDRAGMANVFVGTVVNTARDVDIAEPGFEPWLVPGYVVEVEETLKGEASGRVIVGVVGGEKALARKARYFFAASTPTPSGEYVVDDGFGNLQIRNDAEREKLVTQFTALIEENARNPVARAARASDPCESLDSLPVVQLSPQRGKAGSQVRVDVSNAIRLEAGISWRTEANLLTVGEVGTDCAMSETVTIPRDTKPGTSDIIVMDARMKPVRAAFEVIK